MLNVTIQYLLLSHSLTSPLLSSYGSLKISDTKFSYFTQPAIFKNPNLNLYLLNSNFNRFLSTAIKSNEIDSYFTNQNFIDQRPNTNNNDIYINLCVFKNCVVPVPSSNGGAISAVGSILQINNTAFTSCYTTQPRSMGGAVYSSCQSNLMNNVCAMECHAVDSGQSLYINTRSGNAKINYLSIATCGKSAIESKSSSIHTTGNVLTLTYLNSTGNLVSGKGSGIEVGVIKADDSDSVPSTLSFSSFVNDFGSSTLYLGNAKTTNIDNCNFVSNTASSGIFFLIGTTSPIVNQCIFISNSGNVSTSARSNIVLILRNSVIDAGEWGDATLSNCIVSKTSSYAHQYFASAICFGYIPRTPAPTLKPGQTTYPPGFTPDENATEDVTYSLDSYSDDYSDMTTEDNFTDFDNDTCIDCYPKMHAGMITAVVFDVIEAVAIIVLVVLVVICWRRANNQRHPNQSQQFIQQNQQQINQQKKEVDQQNNNQTQSQFEEEDQDELNLEDVKPNSFMVGKNTPRSNRQNISEAYPSQSPRGRSPRQNQMNSPHGNEYEGDNEDNHNENRRRRRRIRDPEDIYKSGTYSTPRQGQDASNIEQPAESDVTPPFQRRRRRRRREEQVDDESPLIYQKKTRKTDIVFSSDEDSV
ncbi:hypothetical protein TRFO_09852 [Tritrichomonas foetus]|uniref:Right handed beta helix domain-containing protein n=1 Tax=Tritrichomonas foetus TaxID=1144522 RepID=A0A1J4JC23_9EUKA|nr:hypothetical protein TRFO_09852 [Tritrichomonas foetus]|eukprot:OHS96688.1 hypothetical protein TRFO_09852 [Tritrichomonas foetus]